MRTGDQAAGDHGLLSDCSTAALVDRAGTVDWWCVPRFDAASVFGRLLGPDAGHWSLRPAADSATEWAYLTDTLVLRTVHTTATGSVAVTDALAFEAGARGHDVGLRSPHLPLRRVGGPGRHGRDDERAGPATGVRPDRAALAGGARRGAVPADHRARERPGLLAEQGDVDTGAALGNVPQAFSHVGLINAAWRLAHPD